MFGVPASALEEKAVDETARVVSVFDGGRVGETGGAGEDGALIQRPGVLATDGLNDGCEIGFGDVET